MKVASYCPSANCALGATEVRSSRNTDLVYTWKNERNFRSRSYARSAGDTRSLRRTIARPGEPGRRTAKRPGAGTTVSIQAIGAGPFRPVAGSPESAAARRDRQAGKAGNGHARCSRADWPGQQPGPGWLKAGARSRSAPPARREPRPGGPPAGQEGIAGSISLSSSCQRMIAGIYSWTSNEGRRRVAAKRKVDNLMALAVLATVIQRPMHRYEIASLIRARGKDQDMDVKWGSLYTVVQNLAKHGFLEVVGTSRQGARPERTVYQITEAGRQEMLDWARELLSTPEPEHPRFAAGLSVQMILPPDEVIALLQARLGRLEETIAARRAALTGQLQEIPRLFLVEDEFAVAMVEAEAAWVRALLEELTSGSFPDLALWRAFHDGGEMPPELVELAERGLHKRLADEQRPRGGAPTPPPGPGAAARSHPHQRSRTEARTRRTRPRGGNHKDSWALVRDLGPQTTDGHPHAGENHAPRHHVESPHRAGHRRRDRRSRRRDRPAQGRDPGDGVRGLPHPGRRDRRRPGPGPQRPGRARPHRRRRCRPGPGHPDHGHGHGGRREHPQAAQSWRTWSRSRSSAAATCTGCCTTGRPSRASASNTASA